jgi:hypothetical protein
MRKNITFCLYALFLLLLTGVFVPQNAQAQARGAKKQVNNVVKLGIDNFFFGRADFAYERRILPRQSAQFELGVAFPISIPTRFNFTKSFTVSDDTTKFAINMNPGKWQAWSFVPEYRFYLTEDAPRGLYVAPCLKIKPRGFKLDGSYTRPDSLDINGLTVTTVTADVELKGGWRTFGVGVAVGYQFIINDRISIDIAPIGFTVDWHNVYLEFSTNDPGINQYFEEWNTAVTEQVRKIWIIGDRLKMTNGDTDAGGKFIRGSLGFVLLAYRGNVYIGYSF